MAKTWIDRFVEEKGLDRDELFEVQGAWGVNFISLGIVIEAIAFSFGLATSTSRSMVSCNRDRMMSARLAAYVAISSRSAALRSVRASWLTRTWWISLASFCSGPFANSSITAGLGRVEVYRAPTESVWVHSTFSPHESQMSVDLLVCTPDGQPILQALQVSIQQVADTAGRPAEQHEQWLYESQWRRQPLTAALSDLDDQVWLIFLNHGGVADTICSAMQQRGAKCIQITAGEQYRQLAADRYQLNPNDSQEYDSLLREVCAHDSCTGIIHLWSMDGGTYDRGTGTGVTDEPKDTELLAQAQRHGCRSALYLVQSVLRLGLRQAPRLWFATCGTQSVTEADTGIRLAPAPLWGLAQAVAREHPELAGLDVLALAARTDGHSGASLRELLARAARHAAERQRSDPASPAGVEAADLEHALTAVPARPPAAG